MNDQDKRAVEGMARCGIELEGLFAAFPCFPAEEICEIYQMIHKDDNNFTGVNISINCS